MGSRSALPLGSSKNYRLTGPMPMQLVVVSAVRAAVAAALKMRRITSQTEFFFIIPPFFSLTTNHTNHLSYSH